MLVLDRDPQGVVLDGQYGEGGGQILRTSLALAAIGCKRLQIRNIRARRNPPGLRPQHLMAVRAIAQLCGAELHGAQVGSSHLRFLPAPGPARVHAGSHRFDIGTAGSAPLLLHALFPLLCTAEPAGAASAVVLTGGTHLPKAPSAGYLGDVWAAAAERCGFQVAVDLRRPGFYPQGGGELHAVVAAQRGAGGICWLAREGPVRVAARAGVSRAPVSIAQRLLQKVGARLRAEGLPFDEARDGQVVDHGLGLRSSGVYLELVLDTLPVPAGFTVLGERGVLAEIIADRAVDELLLHLRTDAPVDPHLADQLAILLALTTGRTGRYRTSAVTQHLLTHAEVLGALLPVSVEVAGEQDQPGEVRVSASDGQGPL